MTKKNRVVIDKLLRAHLQVLLILHIILILRERERERDIFNLDRYLRFIICIENRSL